jgi:hypothetical protein
VDLSAAAAVRLPSPSSPRQRQRVPWVEPHLQHAAFAGVDVTVGVFAEANAAVRACMRRDYFPRFRRSRAYARLRAQIKSKACISDILKASEMLF